MKKIIVIAIIIVLIPLAVNAQDVYPGINSIEGLTYWGEDYVFNRADEEIIKTVMGITSDTFTQRLYVPRVFINGLNENGEVINNTTIRLTLDIKRNYCSTINGYCCQSMNFGIMTPYHSENVLVWDGDYIVNSFEGLVFRVMIDEEEEKLYLYHETSRTDFDVSLDLSYMKEDKNIHEFSITSIRSEAGKVFDAYKSTDFVEFDGMDTTEYIPYNIHFKYFAEKLVPEQSWAAQIFKEQYPWNDDIWLYVTEVRTEDIYGNEVTGLLTPTPIHNYGIEVFGLTWPPWQFVTFYDLNVTAGERRYNINSFDIGIPTWKHLNFYGKGNIEGFANEYIHFLFITDDEEYRNKSFTIPLGDMRSRSDDYSTWDDPYLLYKFGEIDIVVPVGTEPSDDDDLKEEDLDTYDDDWVDEWGWDDGKWGEKLSTFDLYFDNFVALLKTRAPFAYIMIFFDTLSEIGSYYGTDDLTVTIQTSQVKAGFTDIEINLTGHESIQTMLSMIRTFSGWVLYAGLVLFFYNEYRQFMGQEKLRADGEFAESFIK